MISLALRHKARVLKARMDGDTTRQSATARRSSKRKRSPVESYKAKHQSDTTLDALRVDLERLSALENVADKIVLKRNELIPKYLPIATGYRESDVNPLNDVVIYLVIWLIDVGDIESAIEWACFSHDEKLSMPTRFKRDLPTYVSEEICTWAESQFSKELSATPYLEQVVDFVASDHWSVKNFVVKTKLYKLAALYAERERNWSKAVTLFEKCVAVNPKGHGVKTKLNTARIQLSRQ